MNAKKITTLAGMILAVLSLIVAVQAAPTYSGTLQYDSGIVATPNWNSENTTFRWDVTLVDGSYWNYKYTFSVVGLRDISHIIIETTGPEAEIGAFSFSDMFDLTTNLTLEDGSPEIKLHSPGEGNPNMPADLYGIKFDFAEVDDEDRTTFTVEFNSRRNPMLGNFYAKDGRLDGVDVTAWNSGFLDGREGISLHDAAAHGLIVVPNATVIPAPGAIVLVGIGTTMVGWLRRRRTF